MLGANFDADGTLIMTSSNCATIKKHVSIMNLGDKTGSVARLKKTVFSHHGRIFSRPDHTSPVDKVGPDNNGSEIDVTESTGLDGTQTCGELIICQVQALRGLNLDVQRVAALMWPSTCLENTTMALYCYQANGTCLLRSHLGANSARRISQFALVNSSSLYKR